MRDLPLLIAVLGVPFACVLGLGVGTLSLMSRVKRNAKQFFLLIALVLAPAIIVLALPDRLGTVRFTNAGLAGLSAFLSAFGFILAFLLTVLVGAAARGKARSASS